MANIYTCAFRHNLNVADVTDSFVIHNLPVNIAWGTCIWSLEREEREGVTLENPLALALNSKLKLHKQSYQCQLNI